MARQTGWQDNEARFNGVKTLQYYGVLVDPDLSHLYIVTAGIGIKPVRNTSLEAIWHYYRQVQPASQFRHVALSARPNGKDRDVGGEFDLVLGWLLNKRFEAELDLAVFLSGRAFDAPMRDPAMFVGVELKVNF